MLNIQNKCAMFIKGAPRNLDERARLYGLCKNMDTEELYKFAIKRKIVPFVASTLIELKCNVQFWEKILNEYRERNNRILHFIDLVYKCLHDFGVNKIFVSENFGALLTSDDDIGLFSSGDVDNYSSREEKDKIYAAMKNLGCEIKEKYIVNNLIATEFFPPDLYCLPEGFYFRVDFYPLERLKLPCFIHAENFIDWNKCCYYKDTNIRLAEPTELMYICLMHTSIHSFVRTPDYRLYIDIYNLDKCNIDYDLIYRWSCCDKTKIRMFVALAIYGEIFEENKLHNTLRIKKRVCKLINYVYDRNDRVLKETQSKFKIFKIDIMCNDKSNILGLIEMLFPDRQWMKTTYGNGNLISYVKHILRLF